MTKLNHWMMTVSALLISGGIATPVTAQEKGASLPAAVTDVKVDGGLIRGMSEDRIISWKGIPFAAAPVGPLRWRAPQPVQPWEGVKETIAYGSDCMQVPFPSDAAPLGTPPAEDCLYANVWRPAKVSGKLPVMVWIYGGGFVNGGASPPTYSGAELARQGILVMSFNYRLGRFGTFAHPALLAENADNGLVGNYGFMDQLAALKWVKKNIAAFGGDPDQVTIAGESAGGMSVNMLVTSPMARGLFARAVVMSGGDGSSMGDGGLATAEKISVDFAASKGIAADDPQALAKLRALSAEQVTDGLNMMALFRPGEGPRTFASPFADGKLAVDSGNAYRNGDFAQVPIMIGATSADIGGKTGFMVAGARALGATITDNKRPVYAYRFSYVASSLKDEGAGHATEIPYFFDTTAIKYGAAATKRDLDMGKITSRYLVNFVKAGDPNSSGLPHWPRYDRAKDELMDFAPNGKAVMGKDPWGAEIDAAAAAR